MGVLIYPILVVLLLLKGLKKRSAPLVMYFVLLDDPRQVFVILFDGIQLLNRRIDLPLSHVFPVDITEEVVLLNLADVPSLYRVRY